MENMDDASVWVIVNQDANMEPKAHAGADFEVFLPSKGVTLDGSKSWDDLAIAR